MGPKGEELERGSPLGADETYSWVCAAAESPPIPPSPHRGAIRGRRRRALRVERAG